jgi:hypothetical protein
MAPGYDPDAIPDRIRFDANIRYFIRTGHDGLENHGHGNFGGLVEKSRDFL